MPKKPVVFLSFANPSLKPLSELTKESAAIYQTLLDGAENDRYMIHQDAHTSINSLFYYLNRFANRVVLFHFAGHANLDHILLQREGSDAPELTFMGGVIPKLAQQKNLRCVILNGCSTHEHAKKILELGVPTVIGTNRPIDDVKAREFAEQFYQALAANHTIGEAFDSATSHLTSAYHSKASSQSKRGELLDQTSEEGADIGSRDLIFDVGEEGEHGSFSWHLFYHKGSQALQSRLPMEQIIDLKIQPIPFSFGPQPDTEKLSIDIFNEMLHYEPKLYKWLEENEQKESHHLQAKIIMHLPSTADNQLQALFHLENLDHEYLTQLIKTYDAFLELILFASLSQLWDYKHHHKEIIFPKSFQEACKKFLLLSEEERFQYNTLPMIQAISECFDTYSLPFFIEEMGALREELNEEKELYESWKKMGMIRQEMKDLDEDDMQIAQKAKDCEALFSVLFVRLLFCTRYNMIAINDVMIRKPRHQEPKYEINRAVHAEASFGSRIKYKIDSYTDFTDDQAVILIDEIDNLGKHLNLTPFVIDKNVLDYRKNPMKKFSTSALYFYNHYDQEKEAYVYKSSTHQDWLEISSQKYPNIWNMMETFKASILS